MLGFARRLFDVCRDDVLRLEGGLVGGPLLDLLLLGWHVITRFK